MQKLNEEKIKSFSDLAHQLKTPLTPIMGWADALQDPKILGNLTTEQLRAISTISYNAGKLDNVIENLVDSEKLTKGEMIYENQNFKTGDIFSSLSRYFQKALADKKIKLIINQDQPISINGDKRRIKQIITNLLDYVIVSLPDENGKIELQVKPKGKLLEFRIYYNGSHPDPKVQQVLLEESDEFFFAYGTSQFDSTFGLKISRGLVEGLGGTLWFENNQKGVSFYFTIPDKITR